MSKVIKTTRIFSIDPSLSEWLDTKSGTNKYLNIILKQIKDIEHDKGSSFARNISYSLKKNEEKNQLLSEKIEELEKQKNQK